MDISTTGASADLRPAICRSDSTSTELIHFDASPIRRQSKTPATEVNPPTTETPATEPAGILRRLAAISYDALLLAAVLMLYTAIVILLRGGNAVAPDTAWFSLSLLVVTAAFFVWFWTHGGQTLGMMAWRIRLRTTDGSSLTWRNALIRFLAGFLSLIPAGLGFWWSIWDPEKRCWHDRLSGTKLVYERKSGKKA